MPLLFWRIIGGIVGLALSMLTAVLLFEPINVAAYYFGYGEEIRIEVTVGTDDLGPGPDASEPGVGRVIGEDRTVKVYDVDAGEVITARPRLIEFGENAIVYHGHASVLNGLILIIPAVLSGVPGLFLLPLLAPNWLLLRLAPRLYGSARASHFSSDNDESSEPDRVPPRS